MTATLRTVELEDQMRESVDDEWLLIEARCGIHHSEHPEPRSHAVEITELALQAPENRERGQARRVLRLLERHGEADLPQRTCERAVAVLRCVARYVTAVAANAHP